MLPEFHRPSATYKTNWRWAVCECEAVWKMVVYLPTTRRGRQSQRHGTGGCSWYALLWHILQQRCLTRSKLAPRRAGFASSQKMSATKRRCPTVDAIYFVVPCHECAVHLRTCLLLNESTFAAKPNARNGEKPLGKAFYESARQTPIDDHADQESADSEELSKGHHHCLPKASRRWLSRALQYRFVSARHPPVRKSGGGASRSFN